MLEVVSQHGQVPAYSLQIALGCLDMQAAQRSALKAHFLLAALAPAYLLQVVSEYLVMQAVQRSPLEVHFLSPPLLQMMTLSMH